MKSNRWLVVVNVAAGSGKAGEDWKYVSTLLDKHGFIYDAEYTSRKLHAMVITRNKIEEGYRKIIVVGGDGTMNEVINGIFAQKAVPTAEIMLGMITVGTGNDWAKMFDIPTDYEAAVETIKLQKTFVQDAGMVTYRKSNKTWNRYFINIAGMGFGAKVAAKSNRLKAKGKSSPSLYLVNLLTSLLGYRAIRAEIFIDGKPMDRKVFNLSIGIGKYNGGGMMQLPNAIADDGLYDITLIRKIGKLNVIANISKLYNGKIIQHSKVETYTGKVITIDSKKHLNLETDGETLGHSPLEFQIIPRSVRVIARNISA